LVDDWDLMNRQSKLCKLPATKTVDDILEEYVTNKQSRKGMSPQKASSVKEAANGIRQYFNAMLGSHLLYHFERPQYNDILAQQQTETATESNEKGGGPSRRLSAIYGFPHLLRLFVRIGGMLAFTDLDEKCLEMVTVWLDELLKYLTKRKQDLFHLEDYETAPPEYQRKAYVK